MCLCPQIRNSLTLSRRLPVPVDEPLYIADESESDESVVELEEEEEHVEEFPGISCVHCSCNSCLLLFFFSGLHR